MSKAGLFNTDWRWGRGHRIAVAYAQLHLGDAVGSPTWQAAGAEQRVVAQTGTGAGDCPPNERAGEMTSGLPMNSISRCLLSVIMPKAV